MACLFLIFAAAFPRLVLVLLFLFTNSLRHAYHNLLVPVLGFFFLPLTTVVYAWMVNHHWAVNAGTFGILILAVAVDVGGFGGSWRQRRR
jgi:hypothetical protein